MYSLEEEGKIILLHTKQRYTSEMGQQGQGSRVQLASYTDYMEPPN